MSAPHERIEVTLRPERLARAKRTSEAQGQRYPEDRGDFTAYGGIPRDERLYEAACARQALAQLMGRNTVPKGIKTQWSRLGPASATLKIPDDAESGVRWVLIIGRAPTFQLLGGVWANEASTLGARRTDVPRAAWFIKPDRLHPLKIGTTGEGTA